MDKGIAKEIKANWDAIAKPLDSMGIFEEMICRIGAIRESRDPSLDRKGLLVFCADNGVVAEGISQSGQEVTAVVARGMGRNETSVGRMAEALGVKVITVDIGINSGEIFPGVRQEKIAYGTRNLAREPAMTGEETLRALEVGKRLVSECRDEGVEILALGEMGIGNTTTSSAVAAALLGCDSDDLVGPGAGLDEVRLEKKKKVVKEALERYELDRGRGMDQPMKVLECVGGLDIAGMAGACLGAAECGMPIMLDGVISQVAGLLAVRMKPEVRDYLFASHAGKEPASRRILEELGLTAPIHGGMALGEGCGALMAFPLLDLALEVYRQNRTFQDIAIEPYRRWQK